MTRIRSGFHSLVSAPWDKVSMGMSRYFIAAAFATILIVWLLIAFAS
jgi:hypothetical protein